MKKNNLLLILITSLIFTAFVPNEKLWKGNYFGQGNESDSLQLFAEGIVSTGIYERDIVFSSDGNEAYWGTFVSGFATILCSRQVNGIWTKPEVAPFASDPDFFYLEPALSPDNQKIFFLSTKNPDNEKPLAGWGHQNIWCSEKDENGIWQEAYMLSAAINTKNNEYFPSIALDGTLYFTRVERGKRDTKLYKSELVNGEYQVAEILPDEINGIGNPYNAYISPDEKLLISCIANHPDSKSQDSDYIIYQKDNNGKWMRGKLLGEKVNWKGYNAVSTSFSPDGKYVFFSIEAKSKIPDYNYESFRKHFHSTINGESNIYWIETDKIIFK